MKKSHVIFTIASLVLLLTGSYRAQQPPSATDQVIERFIEREKALADSLPNYSPLAETYIQNLEPDSTVTKAPKSDKYFLGKLDFSKGITGRTLMPGPGVGSSFKNMFTQIYSIRYLADGFSQLILVDPKGFDTEHYDFKPVGKEFLGDVRCIMFDVQPKHRSGDDKFFGRIWVEDKEYNIVRFNGAHGTSDSSKKYFHFDSWRQNMGPNVWLPTYIYSEESAYPYFMGRRKLSFKAQTRIWGYDVVHSGQSDERTSLIVESDKVRDDTVPDENVSPVLSERAWERQAEDNLLQRVQQAGLIAPPSEVDRVIQTVATNLEITNNLSIEPPVRARILLTAPLESFCVGHTIVISRGMLDVLPDEASLAMVIAHELSHIVLDHVVDTKYSFHDRMLFQDEQTFRQITVRRDDAEERAADEKAFDLLSHSPYAAKLGNAGLFLKAVQARSAQLQQLLRPHMGNPLADAGAIVRMKGLMDNAPDLDMANVEQIAALPLGGRIRLDPWSNRIELLKGEQVPLQSPREKMQFEVTPLFPRLTRAGAQPPAAATSATATPNAPQKQ
jgi:hypothetical protein